ncbi:MAG: carbon monoxide dehydrogenase [Actinobacteria bacterium]|nr:MAG: carbon monoxide dehydrogenase [Actinomycetota bacterium]
MEVIEVFTVTRPIDSVWELFQDVPELARCLPGAELTSDNGDGTYDGRVSVKLGPISSSFEGSASVEFSDETYTSNIEGRGVDRSGGSQGRVEVGVHLSSVDGLETDVTINAKVTLAGPIAQFGRTGLVNEVSKRLIDEFSECLEAKLDAESPDAAAAIEASDLAGISLFLSSTWSAFVNWLSRLFSDSDD